MGKIIGIDLGTTNTVVAVIEDCIPTVIPSAESERSTPSVVAINKNCERIIGRLARDQAVLNHSNTIFSIKRFMGRKYDSKEVQHVKKIIPYEISKASNGSVNVKLGGKEYSPSEISSMILGKIKAVAESYLGENVTQAVITVPAYFDDSQRNATKDAGEIAGINVLRIINEPTAAAVAYGLSRKTNELIAVYHFGGGSFDISILEVGDGIFIVKSTSGDTFLGGDDFDNRIIDYLIDEFYKEHSINLRFNQHALQRLKVAAENAKIELSSLKKTEINLPYIATKAFKHRHLSLILSRTKLEELTADLIERSMIPVKRALDDAHIKPTEINNVILAGGMTLMPAVKKAVENIFKKKPLSGVNPFEVVAIGAAIQGGILGGDVNDTLLLDVIPLTLSVETLGGVATPLITRNTPIPASKSQIFSTSDHNQPQVEIHILQGERPMAVDNKTLGKFIFSNIPPAPRGVPQIEVTFNIDVNGILNVVAKDKANDRIQKFTIVASSGLTRTEIERMKCDAKLHADEDIKRKKMVEARNNADNIAYQAEKAIDDLGDTMSEFTKKHIRGKVIEIRKILSDKQADIDIINQATKWYSR